MPKHHFQNMLPVQAKHTFINVIFTQIRLFFVGRSVCYHFVLAKRQFVAMHYSCFCVKLLFLHIVQRPHPTPILQDESCVNLKISITIGKTKKNKTTKTFGPMSPKRVIGPKVLFFLFFLVFPMVFDGFGIDLFGCFVFFCFPNGYWYSQPGSRANPLGDGSVSTSSRCSTHFF